MCDCFHLAFPNWHAASSGTGAGRRLTGPEPGTEDDSICDEPSQFTEGERPRPQGSSPVEEFPETYIDSDKECEAEHDQHHKSGSGKKAKKSGLGSMFEKRSTPKMSKLKEAHSPESGVIVKTAKDGCAEGLVYGGGGKDGIFIKEVIPESPASKSLKLKEGDQILSATVYFDNVSYEDAIQILEHAQAYKLKLCLKRKPDITESEPAIESDVIPEGELPALEMREKGKTKRRGDGRVSWPKFPSFGKGQKSRFTRSHSSSEADEQRKLELSPTTSDTESPIKSQDALKGKKRHKIKLSSLTKRGRISSSEDQDMDTPTTGQISSKILKPHEASDMLSPECLESPSGETPEVCATGDVEVAEDKRFEQKLTEPQTVQHKVELITIDSSLKTADLTVALPDKESTSGIKSPDGKKKKKERSELKMKILGKDKSHKKDTKAKSPKRLKTLGASIEIPDQPENVKSDAILSPESHTKLQEDQLALDANTQIISSESSRGIAAKSMTMQMEMGVPKEELDVSDVAFIRKSPQKSEEKMRKGKGTKQKQETKTGPIFKLPKIGFSDIATEETVQKINVNAEECTTKIEHLTSEGTEVKEDPYEQLSKRSLSRTQLPKREEIEIPGMEDMSMRTTVKGPKEPKAGFTGQYDELQAETVQLSIDVDSVKEAVSKLPGYKLPRVDMSGVPIPEEITVIDANAQRISVKTPTKVVDTKTKYETHFTKFDITASPEISKTTVKLPRITPADSTSEGPLFETRVDLNKTEKKYKTKAKQSDKEIYKREDIVIPGKESGQEVAIRQKQDTEGIKSEYESAVKLSPKESDKKSKKAKITVAGFGIAKPNIKIPELGIDFKQNISQKKGDTVKGEGTIDSQEVKTSNTESRKAKGQIGGVIADVKIPEIDSIEYIDSGAGSPAKKDGGISLTGFGVNLDAVMPNTNTSIPEIKGEVKDVDAEQYTIKTPKFGAATVDISVNVPDADKDINIVGAETNTFEREGKASKFKMPHLDISMPKVKGPKIGASLSQKDVDVTLAEAKAEVKLPNVPEVDITLGNIDVSIPEQKMEVERPGLEIQPLRTEGELDGKGGKFKMPKFGISLPKVKGPQADLSVSKTAVDVTLPEAKAEVKLPHVEHADPGFKVEVKSPEIALPKVKGPQINLSFSKKAVDVPLPEADAEVKLPEAPQGDVSLGKASVSLPEENLEFEKPELEMKPLRSEVEIDGQGGKFKMPKLGMSMPKVKGHEIHFGLSKKDGDVTPQEAKAEAKVPEVELKEPAANVEFKAPEIKVAAIGTEGSSSKFKMPIFKLPKFGVGTQDISVKVSDMHKDVKIDEMDITIPEEESAVNIAAPNIDIEGPQMEMKTIETEQDGKGSKFKMPHLGFSMPKLKGPKIDLNLSKKDRDVTLPEAEAIKLSETDFGKVDVAEAEIEVPVGKAEVKLPEGPKIAVEMKPPEHEAETDVHGGKFKIPKFGIKMPKVKGPEFDLSLSKKNVDVTLPQTNVEVKLPDAPKMDVSLGEAEVLIPEAKVDFEKPDVELEGQGGKFKMPKFGITMPKVKGPEIDLSLSKKDVDVTLPEVKAEVELPKAPEITVDMTPPEHEAETDVHGGKFKIPKFGIKMPKVKGPEFDFSSSKKNVDVTLPQTNVEVKLPDAPKMDVSLGEAEVLIPEANVDFKKPDVEIKPLKTDVELEGQGGKFKMPKFGITMPKVKGPEIDLSLSEKDVDVTLPEAKAEIELPKAPKIAVDMKPPECQEESDGQRSKFKVPKFGISLPKVQGPDIDVSVSKKDVHIKLPEPTAEIELPEAPEIGVIVEKADVSIPEATMEVRKPGLEIKPLQSQGELDGQKSKFKMPKFGISMSKVKGPEIDFSLSKQDVDVTLPEVKADVDLPDADRKEPSVKVEIKAAEIDAPLHDVKGPPSSKFKMPTLKFPNFGVATPNISTEVHDTGKEIKIDGADMHISVPHTDADVPEVKAEVHLPEAEVKKPSGGVVIAQQPSFEVDAKMKKSRFSLPRFSFSKQNVKAQEVDVSHPDLDVAVPEGKVKMKAGEVDMKPPECEGEIVGQGSKFKLPKFGITMPKVAGHETDLSLSKKDIDVTLPEVKAEAKLPDIELKEPSAEVEIKTPEIKIVTRDAEGSPSKFKMPTFKLPKFGVGMASGTVEVPDMDKDIKIEGADIKIPEEVLTVDIAAPSIDTEGPSIHMKTTGTEHEQKGSKFKMPKFGITMPKVTGPEIDLSLSKKDVDVTLPEAKAEVKLPDIELKEPSAEVEIKAPEIKAVTKETEGSPSKFKMPAFKLPKFGVGMPSASVEVPDKDKNIKIDGADIKIPEEVLTVDVAEPSIDIEEPSIHMKTTGTEHEQKGSKFKMPKFGITMPKVTGPEIDLSLSKKDGDVTLPEAKAEVKLPDIELKEPSAEVEIKAPEIKVGTKNTEGSPSKFKMPTFKLPKFGVGMPSASVEVPDTDKNIKIDGTDIKIPEEVLTVDIAAPSIDTEGPSIHMKATGTEHEKKGGKFKMPKFGITMPKVTGPETDVSLSKKDVDVTLPEAKAEVKLPDINLKEPSAEVEIKAPEIEAQVGDVVGSPSKFKMPTFKLPKFGVGMPSASVEVPDTDKNIKIEGADIKIPEEVLTVDIAAPSIESEGPSIHMKTTEHEQKGSKFKMPKFGITMPKVTGPEIDLSLSKKDVDVTLPEAKAEVKLPDIELKEPSAEMEIKAPEIKVVTKNTEGSPSKFKMPTIKLPKFGVGMPSASVEIPDTDKNIKIKGADIKIPEEVLTVDVAAPSIDTERPSIHMKATGIEHEQKGSKFKMPKFGITMPKVAGPEIDLSLSKKDVDVTLPEAKAEVKLPDIELKEPSAEVEIKTPEIKVVTKDAEGSPSKFKMPTFKLPKFGVGMPSARVEVPDTDKNIKIEGADIKIPEEVLTVDVAAPSIDTEGPSIHMKTTGTEHEQKGNKFKLPKFGITMPKVTGPEIDLSLSKKDIDVTLPEAKAEVQLPDVKIRQSSAEVEIKSPEIEAQVGDVGSPSKFKMPTFKLPKFGVGIPSASVEVPDTDKNIKIDGADIKIPEEVLTVDVAAPSIDTEGPSIHMKTTGTEHEQKGSKFKLPKFGITMPKVTGPEINLSLSKKDVDVTLPEAKAEVKLPDTELKEPSAEVEIKAPEIKVVQKNTEGSPSKFKMPTFKLPKFGVGMPSASVEVPDTDKNIKIDGTDIKIPEEVLTVDIAAPSIESEGPSIHMKTTEHEQKGSKFKMPKFGITMPKVTGPEIDLSLSKKDVDVTLPEAKAEVKLPDIELKEPSAEVEIKAPEIKVVTKNTEGSPSKFKMPTIKLPKFGVGMPSASVEVPDTDKNIKIDGADIKIPEEVLTVDVAAPSIDTEGPSIHMKTKGTEHEQKGSKFKMPKFGITMPKVTGPEIDLSLSKKDVDVTLPEAKAEVKLPDIELKEPSAEVEIKAPEIKAVTKDTEGSPSKFKMPTFKLPKFGVGMASGTVEVPDMDKDIKIDGADIKIPEEVLTVDVAEPSIDTEGPSIHMKTTGTEHEKKGSKFKMPKFGITMPKVTGPEIGVSLSKKDVDVTLPEVKAEVQLPDVKIRKSSAEVEIKAPEIEAQAGNVVGSPSKLKMPTFTLPRFGAAIPKVSVEVPDMDKDVNIDGAKLEVPKEGATADVTAPSIDTEGPYVDVKAKGSELEGSGSKFKIPKFGISMPKVRAEQPHVDVSLPEGEAKVKQPEMEIKAPELEAEHGQGSKFKLPKFGITLPKVKGSEEHLNASQKDVDITLPKVKAEVKLPEIEVKSSACVEITDSETEAKSKDVGGSPLKFKMPTMKMPKFGGATYDVTIEAPDADKVAKTDGTKLKEDIAVNIKGPSVDIKTDVSNTGKRDTEMPQTETDSVGHSSPSKFKLPSFRMPKLSFSKSKPEDKTEADSNEDQLEMEVEPKGESKSPKMTLTSFGEIFKNIDVEFDVPKTEKEEETLGTSKDVHETDETSEKQLQPKEKETSAKQDNTKSPERTGWFKFPRFGLSSPSEPAKISEKVEHKDEKSPVRETVDEEISPTCSVQSSDAFADISSAVTSEHVGLSLSSPTKVTVKYSDPNTVTGLEEMHSNIITSTTRTELISVEPNLPEKITILSSGVSSSSEDTLRLESGKLHVFSSNIQATPEAQHAKLLTAVQVQSAEGLPLRSQASEASSWTVEESQSGKRTILERHLVRETSSERSESKETIVVTKQITHMFDSSEPISGETASSIQRLRDSVHSEKMKFFDGDEK